MSFLGFRNQNSTWDVLFLLATASCYFPHLGKLRIIFWPFLPILLHGRCAWSLGFPWGLVSTAFLPGSLRPFCPLLQSCWKVHESFNKSLVGRHNGSVGQ